MFREDVLVRTLLPGPKQTLTTNFIVVMPPPLAAWQDTQKRKRRTRAEADGHLRLQPPQRFDVAVAHRQGRRPNKRLLPTNRQNPREKQNRHPGIKMHPIHLTFGTISPPWPSCSHADIWCGGLP